MNEQERMVELSGINEGTGPTPEFKKGMDEYIKALTKYHDAHYKKNLSNLTPPKFEAKYGKVRVKVVRIETFGDGKSVHCFVNFDGTILKAAGWNAPAKGSRGSIYDKNPPLAGSEFYRR